MGLYDNGFIIQKYVEKPNYCGVDGENWWFCNDNPKLAEYFNQKIDLSWKDELRVDCCNDINFLTECIDFCNINKMRYRILFCKTELCNPLVETQINYFLKFIGYDYAYAGGSYYSCVKNDLVFRKFTELSKIVLNSNGLINDKKQMDLFIKLRTDLISKYNNLLEVGDFIVYKLYEVSI